MNVNKLQMVVGKIFFMDPDFVNENRVDFEALSVQSTGYN